VAKQSSERLRDAENHSRERLREAAQYWLMKSEPDVYSFHSLQAQGEGLWDGVRNYQARNSIQAQKLGDQVLFYHSSCPAPGIYGLAEVTQLAAPDPSQFDPESEYYDPKASADKPRWFASKLRATQAWSPPLLLADMRLMPELDDFALLQKGTRLSVIPVAAAIFKFLVQRQRQLSQP
jgi:predicted RNA-binding protein with PUA-like domain